MKGFNKDEITYVEALKKDLQIINGTNGLYYIKK